MKWEYNVIQIDQAVKAGLGKLTGGALNYNIERISDILKTYGDKGWELVEVIAPVGTAGTANHLLLFFKRQIASVADPTKKVCNHEGQTGDFCTICGERLKG